MAQKNENEFSKQVAHAKKVLREVTELNVKPIQHPDWMKIELRVRMAAIRS